MKNLHQPKRAVNKWPTSCPIAICCTLTILCGAGCGQSIPDVPELGPVDGFVTLSGKMLPDASVTFQPEYGRPSTAVTDETGYFVLRYSATEMGAKVGEHTVLIAPNVSEELMMQMAGNPDQPTPLSDGQPAPVKIPSPYSSGSTMTVTVQATDNFFCFDVESTEE